MKKIMNFLTKSKGKVIIIIIIILAILSLIITFNQNKSNLNGNVGNNNKGNNTEYIPPNFGDTNFLFDSNRVSFSSDAMKSKNVKTAIDELYQALTTGCYVGYTKGTDNGTTYVCNKASSDSAGTVDFDSINVKYNNGTSGLTASNVKAAILELANSIGYCKEYFRKENETSSSYTCKEYIATFTCSDKTYNGDSQTACTCTNCTLGGDYSATNAGSYTATATANANYYLSTTSINWTMNKAPSTLTCNDPDLTQTDRHQTVAQSSYCTIQDPVLITQDNMPKVYTVNCEGDENHTSTSCQLSEGPLSLAPKAYTTSGTECRAKCESLNYSQYAFPGYGYNYTKCLASNPQITGSYYKVRVDYSAYGNELTAGVVDNKITGVTLPCSPTATKNKYYYACWCS